MDDDPQYVQKAPPLMSAVIVHPQAVQHALRANRLILWNGTLKINISRVNVDAELRSAINNYLVNYALAHFKW